MIDQMRRVLQLLAAVVRHLLLPALRPKLRRSRPPEVRLRMAFEELGGAWIKLGQALALRFDVLKSEYCYELFKLLNAVRPFPAEDVRRVLREDFGRDAEEMFSSFDFTPFASASIGQVHRAVLASGAEVAVKVQRPRVRRIIAADIRLMYIVARLVDATPVLGRTRTREVVDEFSRWTGDELDYLVEARQARHLYENARGDRLEKVPEIHTDLCSSRVLTLELIKGIPVIDVLYALEREDQPFLDRLEAEGYDLVQAGVHLTWNTLNQIYRFGYFHADLHPANLFLLPGNAIGYVDFGIVGSLPAHLRDSLLHYASALFGGDVQEAATEWMRWVRPSEWTDLNLARVELTRLLEDFLIDLRARHARTAREGPGLEVAMMGLIRRHRMSVSPAVVMYLKALMTAHAVVFALAPDFDLETYENRFFGKMILEDARGTLDPRTIGALLFQARYRAGRMFATVDVIEEDRRSVGTVAATVRRRVQALASAALASFVLYLVVARPTFASESRSFPVQIALLVGVVVLTGGIIAQGRRLPGPEERTRQRYAARRQLLRKVRG